MLVALYALGCVVAMVVFMTGWYVYAERNDQRLSGDQVFLATVWSFLWPVVLVGYVVISIVLLLFRVIPKALARRYIDRHAQA